VVTPPVHYVYADGLYVIDDLPLSWLPDYSKATKKYNSNCPICRGHVNSAPKPNYLVDEMARIFFNQISDDEEEPNPTDRKDWEKRTA